MRTLLLNPWMAPHKIISWERAVVLAAYQRFLVEELGLAPKANLVGMSWGGFFSTRYAARYPQNVCRIYLDAPLLTFAGCSQLRIGPWAETRRSVWL